jgi:hypothetical protein
MTMTNPRWSVAYDHLADRIVLVLHGQVGVDLAVVIDPDPDAAPRLITAQTSAHAAPKQAAKHRARTRSGGRQRIPLVRGRAPLLRPRRAVPGLASRRPTPPARRTPCRLIARHRATGRRGFGAVPSRRTFDEHHDRCPLRPLRL